MIDRRRFIGTLAGGVLGAPLIGFAQQPAKLVRFGRLGGGESPIWEAFGQGMRDLGYVEGRDFTLETRWSEGKTERLPALALELVEAKVDIIVAAGTQATRAAKEATSTIPIVMAVSAHPEKIGLVKSLARPGGNVTGLDNVGSDLKGKQLQFLKELVPKASRVAILWNQANPVETFGFKEMAAAAVLARLEIHSIDVQKPEDYAAAFASVTESGSDAVYAFGNPVNFRILQLIVDFALKSRLPSVFEERLFVASGGLLSYAPSYADLFRRAATYVDRILKGASPADLPVEQPTKFELVINEKTAKALGINIVQSLLLRADEVIR